MILITVGALTLFLPQVTANTGPTIPPLDLAVRSNSNKQLHAKELLRSLETVSGWFQIGQDINGQAAGDLSGWAVSMSEDGSRVAVAAPEEDSKLEYIDPLSSSNEANSSNAANSYYNNGVDAGSVRVFEFDYASWELLGQPLLGVTGAGTGQSVSLSGDGQTVAVGSFRLFPYNGYVQIYRFGYNNRWRLLIQLDGIANRDRFGGSISMNYDGTRVAIGAAYHEGTGARVGKTEIYEQAAGAETTWNLIGEIYGDAVGDKSGHSVALSADGNTVAIGECTADPGYVVDAGNTVVYRSTSYHSWTQVGEDIPGVAQGEKSGSSVAISQDGSIVAIGSPMHSSQANLAGMARVFAYEQDAWVQLGNSIFPETAFNVGQFGISVSLSYNGLIMAIGEPNEEGVGNAGIYYYSSDLYDWRRDVTLSAGAVGDRFGYSVALSGAGKHLAVGAHTADPAGHDSGKTRVYEFQTSDFVFRLENVEAAFGTGTEPEFTLTYQGVAPTTSSTRTYQMRVLMASCVLGPASSDAIAPVAPTGSVPHGASFQLVTELVVNHDTISSSAFFSQVDMMTGNLAFCVELEILEGYDSQVKRLSDITFEIDMGQDFVKPLDFRPVPAGDDFYGETRFSYGFRDFFCDEYGNEINGGPIPPGGEVSVCLEANANEPVLVADVKSVSFENTLSPLLGVDLIDDWGNPIQDSTVKDCSFAGVCRITAITVPRLYEHQDSSGSTLDVSGRVQMDGIVVFVFPHRRGLQDGSERLETTFTVELDLAKPPDRTGSLESSACIMRDHSVMSMITLSSVALACFLFL